MLTKLQNIRFRIVSYPFVNTTLKFKLTFDPPAYANNRDLLIFICLIVLIISTFLICFRTKSVRKTTSLKSKKSSADSFYTRQIRCPICLVRFKKDDYYTTTGARRIIFLNCLHRYHVHCYTNLRNYHSECSICRTKINWYPY